MFNRSVESVIQTLRNSNTDAPDFINKAITECKDELKNKDFDVKANALRKVVYFNLIGINVSWANFHIIELMSSRNYSKQRLAFAAASEIIKSDSEELLLLPNLLSTRLNTFNDTFASHADRFYSVSLVLKLLAEILTPELVIILFQSVSQISKSVDKKSKGEIQIHNRCTMLLLNMYSVNPDTCTLKFLFHILSLQLTNFSNESANQISATINVISELCFKNPRKFIKSMPVFIDLIVKLKNNWLLIKLNILTSNILKNTNPADGKRITKRFVPVLLKSLKETSAKSLLYEAVKTSITCFSFHDFQDLEKDVRGELLDLLKMCFDTLDVFVGSNDRNLVFLGLQAYLDLILVTRMKQNSNIRKEITEKCLNDPDSSLKLKTVDVLSKLADLNENFGEKISLVQYLINHVENKGTSSLLKQKILSCILNIDLTLNKQSLKYFTSYLNLLRKIIQVNNIESNSQFENPIQFKTRKTNNDKLAELFMNLFVSTSSSEKLSKKIFAILFQFLNSTFQELYNFFPNPSSVTSNLLTPYEQPLNILLLILSEFPKFKSEDKGVISLIKQLVSYPTIPASSMYMLSSLDKPQSNDLPLQPLRNMLVSLCNKNKPIESLKSNVSDFNFGSLWLSISEDRGFEHRYRNMLSSEGIDSKKVIKSVEAVVKVDELTEVVESRIDQYQKENEIYYLESGPPQDLVVEAVVAEFAQQSEEELSEIDDLSEIFVKDVGEEQIQVFESGSDEEDLSLVLKNNNNVAVDSVKDEKTTSNVPKEKKKKRKKKHRKKSKVKDKQNGEMREDLLSFS